MVATPHQQRTLEITIEPKKSFICNKSCSSLDPNGPSEPKPLSRPLLRLPQLIPHI